jgi:membrane glycosyltransferase
MNLPSAPRVRRSPMRPTPWFGFWRGLLLALWTRLSPHPFGLTSPTPASWSQAAQQRRRVLLLIVALLGLGTFALQWQVRPVSPSALWWAYSVLQSMLLAWVGAGFVTALMGAWVLWRGDRHALRLASPRAPIDRQARTAVIMPICNEDIGTVFGGLRATAESVAATGALALFDFYLLSDTSDPAIRAAEWQAWERLKQMLGDEPTLAGGRVFYRWRRRRVKRKAGNVADFCRRWGADYRYMVVLDADSTMHGETLVQLVRLMEQNPRAGIVQTLPQPCGHGTLHARAQQFAHRVTGRLFSLGMAYWQLGDSHYWGHNAIIRVQPFMRHCALARLPGRGGLAGEILSHDFVEAAMMARAGWEVWLAPELTGSWEQNPPHLLDELQRDRRWCQGNLQNARLVAEPGWRAVHRVMLGTAAFSYAVAPLWLLFMALGAWSGAFPGGADSTIEPLPWLWLLTLVLLMLPRVLGVLAVIVLRQQAPFGGTARLAIGAVAEALISAFQAPVRMLAHALFVTSALTGLKLDWKSPSRQAQGIAWADAGRRLGPLALPVLAVACLSLGPAHSTDPAWWPMLLPLLLAVPMAVAGAHPAVGQWVERAGVLWNPEDRQPPRPLARSAETQGFLDLLPSPAAVSSVVKTNGRAAARMSALLGLRPRTLLASMACALAVLAVVPRVGVTPEISEAMRFELQLQAAIQQERERYAAASEAAEQARREAALRAARADARPARMIDDAVRERAMRAVERALKEEQMRQLEQATDPMTSA